MTAESSPQHRILRSALLDPIGEGRALLGRLQSNEKFQQYLRERSPYALALAAGVALSALALAGGTMAFLLGGGNLFAVILTALLAPVVLIGGALVQAYVLLSWLEGRSLAQLQEQRRARERGPAARWIAQRFRIDLGPPPRVPWVPAVALVVLPAAALAVLAPAIAAGLAVLLSAAVVVYASRDPVAGAGGTTEVAAGTGDLDFSAAARQPGGGFTERIQSVAESARRAARSARQSGQRGARFLVQLCLLNLPPFVEYCAMVAGLFLVWTGGRSGAARELALGVALVGGALLLGGLASIVTKRMSFRFYVDPRTGHAGAWAIVAGLMQLIAGGFALAAAHALATDAWQARLDYLQANPWPLLVPLSVLLICAGLLLMRPTRDRVGPLGTLLYVVPKTLIGIAALAAGVAIVGGGGWKVFDPLGFQAFLGLVPGEYLELLAIGRKG